MIISVAVSRYLVRYLGSDCLFNRGLDGIQQFLRIASRGTQTHNGKANGKSEQHIDFLHRDSFLCVLFIRRDLPSNATLSYRLPESKRKVKSAAVKVRWLRKQDA